MAKKKGEKSVDRPPEVPLALVVIQEKQKKK
jgi:hypothetical protein